MLEYAGGAQPINKSRIKKTLGINSNEHKLKLYMEMCAESEVVK